MQIVSKQLYSIKQVIVCQKKKSESDLWKQRVFFFYITNTKSIYFQIAIEKLLLLVLL